MACIYVFVFFAGLDSDSCRMASRRSKKATLKRLLAPLANPDQPENPMMQIPRLPESKTWDKVQLM